MEFDINQRPMDLAEIILSHDPQILGLGVYIWNVQPVTELVSILKRLRPGLTIVLGGPEVSYECDQQPVVALADYVITGEADLAFRDLCRTLLSGGRPAFKIIPATLPTFDQLELPYHLYSDDDLAHRIVYIEASRGCPFTCEFCLSSLDIPVRALPLDRLLPAMQGLLDRGLHHFKFVDRTFNLNLNTSRAILQFFLDRLRPGLFLHFEMVPDRLPEGLREIIAQFPAGTLQFEVGIQTFDEATGKAISRRQNYDRLADNFRYLREHTGVHIHADLIAGLPGEDLVSFGAGFDRLVALRPQEIQVGLLKRLRGTPIIRHDATHQMVYSAHPPYEVLSTGALSFADLQRLRRFSKYWDLVGNSGNFPGTLALLWRDAPSPFHAFLSFSDWLHEKLGRTDGVALLKLLALLFEHLTARSGIAPEQAATTLWADYTRQGRQDKIPRYLQPYLPAQQPSAKPAARPASELPARQARHLDAPPVS